MQLHRRIDSPSQHHNVTTPHLDGFGVDARRDRNVDDGRLAIPVRFRSRLQNHETFQDQPAIPRNKPVVMSDQPDGDLMNEIARRSQMDRVSVKARRKFSVNKHVDMAAVAECFSWGVPLHDPEIR